MNKYDAEMFFSERIEILDRINEVRGMLITIKDYMNTFHGNDKAIEFIFESVDCQLDEARMMAMGSYGKWGSIESILKKDSESGN